MSEAIPDDPNADFWKKLTGQYVALMGQVIVDPRNFNPAIDLVAVRAVYSDKEVAFHLTWDDPTESKGDGKQTFADAIELQFPPQPVAGTERPYFLMGDANDARLPAALGERARASARRAGTVRRRSRRSPAARPAARRSSPTASIAS